MGHKDILQKAKDSVENKNPNATMELKSMHIYIHTHTHTIFCIKNERTKHVSLYILQSLCKYC